MKPTQQNPSQEGAIRWSKYPTLYGSFRSITTFTTACHEPILCHLPPKYPLTHDLDDNCALQTVTQWVVVVCYWCCRTTYQSHLQESKIQNGIVNVHLNITSLPITRLRLPTPTCSKRFLYPLDFWLYNSCFIPLTVYQHNLKDKNYSNQLQHTIYDSKKTINWELRLTPSPDVSEDCAICQGEQFWKISTNHQDNVTKIIHEATRVLICCKYLPLSRQHHYLKSTSMLFNYAIWRTKHTKLSRNGIYRLSWPSSWTVMFLTCIQ